MKLGTKLLIGAGAVGAALLWAFSAQAGTPEMHTITLVPGQTIILRAKVGDLVTVLAPQGWGVPSAASNVPGFLQVESASADTESTVFKITDGGAGQISMSVGGETAVLSIDVS